MARRRVGKVSRTRVSSVTAPSFNGTLKSTRINTRLPRKSRSLIVSLFMYSLGNGGSCRRLSGHYLAISLIKSRQRQEYPHSLSYQASTFTHRSPTTFVYPASTIEEWGLPLKSAETSSSSV